MNHRTSAHVPKISVVVPVRNEAGSIRTLIEGLLRQTLPPDEIVITDGGSTDNTADIIEEFVQSGAPINLVRESFSLPGRSRNVGAANARNEWIAFTDAGTRPEPHWIERLFAAADHSDTDVVYGSFEPVIDTFFKECAAIAYVPPRGESGARPHSIISALMRRSVWQSAGGFPEDLRSAEDLLFMRKIEAAGFRLAHAPDAIVHWELQPNLWRTFRRFTAYARNNIRAGLWREWQLAIFMRYALLVVFAVPAVFNGWWWLIVPASLWLGMMLGRGAKSILRNRATYPANPVRNLARLVMLMPILTVIDLSVAVGSITWLVRDAGRH